MAESTIQTQQNNGAVTAREEETREPDRFVSPAVDIFETKEGLVVVADMPGLEKSDVEVAVEKDVLTIRAAAHQRMEQDWTYQEFEPVGYYRQFRLGSKIDQTRIEAQYKHGVLNLTLPFAEEAQPRQIEVKVG